MKILFYRYNSCIEENPVLNDKTLYVRCLADNEKFFSTDFMYWLSYNRSAIILTEAGFEVTHNERPSYCGEFSKEAIFKIQLLMNEDGFFIINV